MKQNHEFDKHIENYRQSLDKALAVSGETSDFFARYKAKKLLEWFPELKDKASTILDYGCGDGVMTHYTQKALPKSKLYGTDPSSQSIAHAAKHYPSIKFTTLKNNTLDFPKASFDLVYAAGVFHHIPFAQHKHYLRQIMNTLKPGGHFVLFELNPNNPLTRRTFKRCPIDKSATMLTPRYAKALFTAKPKLIYYFFFPAFLKKARSLEKYLSWLPLGALYACVAQKAKGPLSEL